MIRVGLILIALALAIQEPPRHDKYKDDAAAYCYNLATSGSQGPRRARDSHAHACACHLLCKRDDTGQVVGDSEDQTCELYCTRERCACHVESPCEGH